MPSHDDEMRNEKYMMERDSESFDAAEADIPRNDELDKIIGQVIKKVVVDPLLEETRFKASVTKITNDLADLLIAKNKKYGNSALEPKRIFSKASAVEQILVRIDDKLSRMANQDGTDDEDVIEDLMGYLVLLKIAKSNVL